MIIKKYYIQSFYTEDSEPKFAYGFLQQFTEVHVLDAIPNATIKDADVKKDIANKIGNSSLAKILPYFSKEKNDRDSRDKAANYALLQSFRQKSAPRVFRVYSLPEFRSFDHSNSYDMILRCPCNVLIPRSHLPKNAKSTSGIIMCKFLSIIIK